MTRGRPPLSTLRVRPVATESCVYRGYTFTYRGNRDVIVTRPDGRVLGVAYSPSGARRIVRGYRNAP